MSGLWDTPGIPHTAWLFVNLVDLESESVWLKTHGNLGLAKDRCEY